MGDWGQDYDEDGNVIGEVPEQDPMFVTKHSKKLVGTALILFLLNFPTVSWVESPGIPIGAAFGACIFSYIIVRGYVWIT